MRRALDLLHIDDDDAEALGLSEEIVFFYRAPAIKKKYRALALGLSEKILIIQSPPQKMSLAYISPRWASAKKYVIYYYSAPLQPKAHII